MGVIFSSKCAINVWRLGSVYVLGVRLLVAIGSEMDCGREKYGSAGVEKREIRPGREKSREEKEGEDGLSSLFMLQLTLPILRADTIYQ